MDSQTIYIALDEPLLPGKKLTAGRLSCLYEHGRLRYIKYDGNEIIRLVYFAVRDPEWRTAEYLIEKEWIVDDSSGFTISYSALHRLDDISYRVDVRLNFSNDMLLFAVKGTALTSFKRNRIGICVLHPVSTCSGLPVEVTAPDGGVYTSIFPHLISPHQPFKNIRELKYWTGGQFVATFSFEGDTFETEDQRNWGDGTFKTYSTPLEIPIPVEVVKGETLEQAVQIRFSGHPELNVSNEVAATKTRFPKIGYEAPSGNQGLSKKEIALLREILFDHYRVEISLADNDWSKRLEQRLHEASLLQTKIELILEFEDALNEVQKFIDFIGLQSDLVESILVLQNGHPTADWTTFDAVHRMIKNKYPHISVGYGTNGFFAELNRHRPEGDLPDFVSFSLSPQVHASDTRSIIENLQQFKDTIATIRSFAPGTMIHVSPITFKIRSSNSESGSPRDYDPRQHTSFGAWWTLGCIQQLAASDRLTFYQVTGYRGIRSDINESADNSELYRVMKELKRFKPRWVISQEVLKEDQLPRTIIFENEQGDLLEFCSDR